MSDTVKITVNLANENLEIVKDLAAKQNASMTTVINKAIYMEKLIDDTQRSGGKVILEDSDGNRKEVIFR